MKKINLLIVALIIIFVSCDIIENRFIFIENHSEQNIVSFISRKDMNEMVAITETKIAVDIKANNFGTLSTSKIRWEEYVKSCQGSKIRIYIIKKDSVSKYGWETILKKNIYNEKYVYSIKDLENINWKITFK